MKWWSGTKAVTAEQFETQQQKLRRLTGEVVRVHEKAVDAEVHDPARLKAVYGSAFASASCTRQAQVVALMASSMLKVPNCHVTMVLDDRQESVAAVEDGAVVDSSDKDMPVSESWCKHVIATGREFAVNAGAEHPLVCDTKVARDGDIVSYLGVPIATRDNIIVGVLCVFDSVRREWSVVDVSMLTQLSLVLTRALEPVPA